MILALKQMTGILNGFHDFLTQITTILGFNLTDKQLHFWVIGIIGIILFLIANAIFKQLAKISITSISFIFTFTVMVIFVFAIEIEQKITHKGNMEFADIVAGLWGFIYFFLFYVLIRAIIYLIKKIIEVKKNDKTNIQK